MRDTLLTFLGNLLQVLQEPTSNLAVSALLLAGVILLVLIAIVSVLLYLTGPVKPKTAEAEEAAPEPIRRPRKRFSPETAAKTHAGLGWVTVTLVLAAVVSSVVVTGTRTFCADACHHGATVARSDIQSVHAGLSCAACHEHGGAAVVGNPVARAGHVLRAYGVGDFRYPLPVPSDSCLRCHREDTSETSASARAGVRMSHKEPLAAGMTCPQCHAGIGHEEKVARTPMSRCVPCHAGSAASADCETCHTGDPGDSSLEAVAGGGRLFTKVKLPPVEDCGGCHSQKPCDECHKVRMPHSRAFRAGTHARQAGFSRKEVCWGCHVLDDCGACHTTNWNAHGENFAKRHQANDPNAACSACHKGHTGSFCKVCH